MSTVWQDIVDRLHHHARAAAPDVQHYIVKRVSPLTLEEISGDNVLTDGDDDFVVARTLRLTPPSSGDVLKVLFHEDEYTALDVDQ